MNFPFHLKNELYAERLLGGGTGELLSYIGNYVLKRQIYLFILVSVVLGKSIKSTYEGSTWLIYLLPRTVKYIFVVVIFYSAFMSYFPLVQNFMVQ